MEQSQELAARIRARIGELEADLEAHRRALAALEGRPSHTTAPSSNAQKRRGGRERAKSASRLVAERAEKSAAAATAPKRRRRPVVSADAVFDVVKKGNDQAAEIAKQFGVSTAVVRQRLEQLEQAGRVSRTGERRGTRWRSHAAS